MSEIRNKYILINQIYERHENSECPYCGTPLAEFFTGKKLRDGCGTCDLQIRDCDYFYAIQYIVKYGKQLTKD